MKANYADFDDLDFEKYFWADFPENNKQIIKRIQNLEWYLLGRIQAKCEQIQHLPVSPAVAEELSELYLARGVSSTAAIEGSTFTADEVLQIRHQQLEAQPSQQYIQKDVENIYAAFDSIKHEDSSGSNRPLTVERICELHALIYDGLSEPKKDVPGQMPGQIRSSSVGVARYRAPDAKHCRKLLDGLCAWLEDFLMADSPDGSNPDGSNTDGADDGRHASSNLHQVNAEFFGKAVLAAVLVHVYLLLIHPFQDGNGRLSRAVEMKILLSHNIPEMSVYLLSNHYNETRARYYQLLDEVSHERSFPVEKFIRYALEGLSDQLDAQLDELRNENMRLLVAGHVQQEFLGKMKLLEMRQRELATALALNGQPVELYAVPSLSPQLVKYYEKLTHKTVTRDINTLSKLGIATLTPAGVEINRNFFTQSHSNALRH